jgi:hypothetical protein
LQLYDLYEDQEAQAINIREVMLGLNNFSGATQDQKARPQRKRPCLFTVHHHLSLHSSVLKRISLAPFCAVVQVSFCFHLFDEDRSNSIEENELMAILKANHMAGDPTAVQRKAQTIMRQADNDGDGCITLEEFHVIAQKVRSGGLASV